MTDDQRRELAQALHMCLVLLDDVLCNWFDFSRKPRGKYCTTDTDG